MQPYNPFFKMNKSIRRTAVAAVLASMLASAVSPAFAASYIYRVPNKVGAVLSGSSGSGSGGTNSGGGTDSGSSSGGSGTGSSGSGTTPEVETLTLSDAYADKTSLDVGGTTTLYARVINNKNENKVGATVQWAVSAGTLSASSSTTGANGFASVTYTAGSAGSATYTASIDGSSKGGAIAVSAPVYTLANFWTQSTTSAPWGFITVAALVKDKNGVVVPNVPVTYTTTAGSFSPAQAVTGSTGFAYTQLSAPGTEQTYTITATLPGGVTQSKTMSVVAPGPQLSLAVTSASSVPVGTKIAFKATMANEDGSTYTGTAEVSRSNCGFFVKPGGGDPNVAWNDPASPYTATMTFTANGTFEMVFPSACSTSVNLTDLDTYKSKSVSVSWY